MNPLIARLTERFIQMKLKGDPIKCSLPASEEEIDRCYTLLKSIEPCLDPSKLTKKDLRSYSNLQAFLDSHCHSSHNIFQIKKCFDTTCRYCKQYPVFSDYTVFEELSFLPLPVPDISKKSTFHLVNLMVLLQLIHIVLLCNLLEMLMLLRVIKNARFCPAVLGCVV